MGRRLLAIALIATLLLAGCSPSPPALASASSPALPSASPTGPVGAVVLEIDGDADVELLEEDPLSALMQALPGCMPLLFEASGGDTCSIEHSISKEASGRVERIYKLIIYGDADLEALKRIIAESGGDVSISEDKSSGAHVFYVAQTLNNDVSSHLIDEAYPLSDIDMPGAFDRPADYRGIYISSLENKPVFNRTWNLSQEEFEAAERFFSRTLAADQGGSDLDRRYHGQYGDYTLNVNLVSTGGEYRAETELTPRASVKTR